MAALASPSKSEKMDFEVVDLISPVKNEKTSINFCDRPSTPRNSKRNECTNSFAVMLCEENVNRPIIENEMHNPSPPPEFRKKNRKTSTKQEIPSPNEPMEWTAIRKKVRDLKDFHLKPTAVLVNDNWNTYDTNDFHCEPCNLTLNSLSTFNAHVEGRKHSKVIKDLAKRKELLAASEYETVQFSGELVKVHPKPVMRRAIIQDEIDATKAPCVGLDHVTEVLRLDKQSDPMYICSICDVTCQIVSIVPHIIGQRHCLNFLKQYDPQAFGHYSGKFHKNAVGSYFSKRRDVFPQKMIVCKVEVNPNLLDLYASQREQVNSGGFKKPAKVHCFGDLKRVDFEQSTPEQFVQLFKDLVSSLGKDDCTSKQYNNWFLVAEMANNLSIEYIYESNSKVVKEDWAKELTCENLEPFTKAFHYSMRNVGDDLKSCIERMKETGELVILSKKTAAQM